MFPIRTPLKIKLNPLIIKIFDIDSLFDPKTFKEIIQVVKNNFKGSDIKNIRLIQDWIWDADNNQLGIVYQGFAPIIDRVDSQGNFLNSGPMFVRRVGRDK